MSKTSDLKIQECDKLKIVCLHGYRQNADTFRSKLGSFRKNVQKFAEFVFVSGLCSFYS